MTEKRACKGITRAGNPCKAHPLHDSDHCLSHDLVARETVRFSGPQKGAGRPPKPKVTDILREKVEAQADAIVKAMFDALEAERGQILVGKGEDQEIIAFADHPTRVAAANALLDRVYGKPKQTTELSGPEGGPISTVQVPTERAAEVAGILAEAGVVAAPLPASNGNGSNGNGHH